MSLSLLRPAGTTEPASVPPRKLWHVGTLTYSRTGLVTLFCWLLWGDFAWQMRDRAIPPVMQLLLKKFGASDTFASVVFGSVPSILCLILAPIVSYKSDRYRSRWGRRIPFLLAGTPFTVLGMIGLAFSPALGVRLDHWLGPRSLGPNTSVLICFLVFWIVFELACTVSTGLYGALVNDVVPGPLLGRFYGLFRVLSLLAGILFYDGMFGHADTLYVWIFLGMAALYGFGFTLMCLRVREGKYPAEVPMDQGRSLRRAFGALATYFQECFGNGYYRLFFGATIAAEMATAPFNLFSVFYSTSVGMSPTIYGKCLALTYVISLILAYPLGWLADYFHPLRLWLIFMSLYGLVMLVSFFLVRDAHTFGVALVVHGVVAGSAGTASASIAQRLLPRAEFAQFSSAKGIFSGLLWIVLPPAVGIFLDHMHHEYRYTFLFNACLAFMGFIGLWALHARFMALGGPKNYVAPE